MYIRYFGIFRTEPEEGTEFLSEEVLRSVRRNGSLRRADRYTTLLVAMARLTAERCGLTPPFTDTALIDVTAWGPHNTTFSVLDDILDYPEDQVLPTKFSHSVHNVAPSYVGIELGIHGAIYTLSGFDDPWFDAVELASALLGCYSRVLILGLDEAGCLTEALPRLWPKRFDREWREGGAALLLSRDPAENCYGTLELTRGEPAVSGRFDFGCDAGFAPRPGMEKVILRRCPPHEDNGEGGWKNG